MRLVERFPNWIKDPDTFWSMDDEWKVRLFTYNHIRIAEEWELALVGIGSIK